jgi:N-acetyl-anhydromuramoyl-L-alanine amidase
MNIDFTTGLLTNVPFCLSEHCDERPERQIIDMIVIHNISLPPGQFGTGIVEQFFCGNLNVAAHPYFSTIASLRVSSHLFINRLGQITQFVPFSKRAWHAGVSNFKGQESCNDFSIGIELEGTDELPYEKIQYLQLVRIIKCLMLTYAAISRDRIVGHSDIAPGRKTDPGPLFDWDCVDRLMYRLI